MNVIRECARLHNQEQRGAKSIFLYYWYYLHLRILCDCELITEQDYKTFEVMGYILFQKATKEILVITVAKKFQGLGVGSNLINKLPLPVFVAYDAGHQPTSKFYMKNGFRLIYKLYDDGEFNEWKAEKVK